MKKMNNNYTDPNTKNQVRKLLTEGLVELTFVRADGVVRTMESTLRPDLIPKLPMDSHVGPPNEGLQVVWDVKANEGTGGWRSFRWERLNSVVAK